MRRVFKILGWVLLVVISLLLLAVLVLNVRYGTAAKRNAEMQESLSTESNSFYTFEFSPLPDEQPKLLPVPKKVEWKEGFYVWPRSWTLEQIPEDFPRWMDDELLSVSEGSGRANLLLRESRSLSSEGYRLSISASGAIIEYATSSGLNYGLITLTQLQKLYPEGIREIQISDEPSLPIRGVMLDISRDKVPTLQTLYGIIDQLAMLKYNHVQLYVEGFSFGYPSYRHLWEATETPITPEEVRQLDKYCQARFIDLAANHNMLGHMEPWLKTMDFNDLAECPDGYSIIPGRKMTTTIDPKDPRTLPLLRQMTDDLLQNFTSDIFNANLDEPFELGKCKNEDLAEEIGVGRIYLDHVLEVKKMADVHGKKMWMWADIVGKHPEIIEDLPKDITLLEWGYEAEHPFDKTTARIKDAGLDFIVCPGTSSWMSLTGRTDNMLGNIENAVTAGLANGAKGMLLTDWGDLGHWQYLPISYAGFAYAASVSWNAEETRRVPLEDYLNTFLFLDEAGEMGAVALEIGRYNQYEDIALPNANNAFMSFQLGIMDPVLQDAIPGIMESAIGGLMGPDLAEVMASRFDTRKPYDLTGIMDHLEEVELRLEQSDMQFREVNIVKDELRNGMNMVRLGSQLKAFGRAKGGMTKEDKIAQLEEMKAAIQSIMLEHERLWLLRNKPGGLDRSMKTFISTEAAIDRQIELAEGSGIGRGVERLKERTIAGGADFYAN